MRFYELNGGRILIDGVDLQELSREQTRSLFAMVLQDTWLFSGTIHENIAYGEKGATDIEVREAAYVAYVDDFIRKLPEGYDTVLNQNASNISHGQKQLLTIVRAIIADPKILILDEATSSVDTRTELNIQKSMNHGDIIEQGTHQQLLEQNGFYTDLSYSQFDNNKRKGLKL